MSHTVTTKKAGEALIEGIGWCDVVNCGNGVRGVIPHAGPGEFFSVTIETFMVAGKVIELKEDAKP